MVQTTKGRATFAQPGHPGRTGFSLVELLVASTLMLLVMAAVASLFGVFGATVTEARAVSDLSASLQRVQWRLRQDLAGLTCVPEPLVRVEANAGYFQVIQGPFPPEPPNPANPNDRLALTTSSPGAPFLGRLSGAMGFESPTAEVVWFTEPSTILKGQQLYNLYRRQLLVVATPDAGAFVGNVFGPKVNSDLSYGWNAGTDTYANSLGDLSKPANRFLNIIQATPGGSRILTLPRDGEDVILRNVLTFAINIVNQTGNGGDTYPMVPAALPFETRDDGNPALPPLKQVEVTIRCLEPLTGQVRVIEVQHSFGEDRIPLP